MRLPAMRCEVWVQMLRSCKPNCFATKALTADMWDPRTRQFEELASLLSETMDKLSLSIVQKTECMPAQ
eukprot:1633648-Amphidinium_carterae.1